MLDQGERRVGQRGRTREKEVGYGGAGEFFRATRSQGLARPQTGSRAEETAQRVKQVGRSRIAPSLLVRADPFAESLPGRADYCVDHGHSRQAPSTLALWFIQPQRVLVGIKFGHATGLRQQELLQIVPRNQ